MSWGSSWDKVIKPMQEQIKWPLSENTAGVPENWGNWPKVPALKGIDIATGERTVLTILEHDGIKHKLIHQSQLKSQGSNLVDDQQYLYFQCEECNEILDPHTQSFATLQEHRVNAGWKC